MATCPARRSRRPVATARTPAAAARRGRLIEPDQTGHVAHLAAGPGLFLAVEVEVGAAVGEEVAPGCRLAADQVAHLDRGRRARRRAERQAADRPDMVLELRG